MAVPALELWELMPRAVLLWFCMPQFVEGYSGPLATHFCHYGEVEGAGWEGSNTKDDAAVKAGGFLNGTS
jgi:hypothetical protein